jgi:2OG-Fe(II) oxygenase superfamily
METYIYENRYSIPDILCDEIVNLYESSSTKYKGVTRGGVNETVKKTMDMLIPKEAHSTTSCWSKIEEFLYRELNENLKKYLENVNNFKQLSKEENNNHNVCFLKGLNLQVDHFMIQKYVKEEGFYIYHDDFEADFKKSRYRVITFLWYLNDVDEGGETEFWGSKCIKPEKGKLILFPAFWCFPHRGKLPISSDKYIITGWFYLPETKTKV